MKYFKLLVSLGIMIALVVGVSLFANQNSQMSITENEQEGSNKNATTASSPANTQSKRPLGVFDVESVNEQIEKLPPEERELAKTAKKSLRIHKDENGNYMLVEVDGKMIRKDPALKYLKDYKKSDPEDADVLPKIEKMIESKITTEAVGR